MKKIILPLFVVLGLMLAACGPAGIETPDMLEDAISFVDIPPGEPVHIAYMLATSGAVEVLGADSLGGIQIAIDDFGQIHDHDIQLTGEDSLCSPEGGQTAAQKVASDPTIIAVIGTNCSSAGTAASPVLSEAGILMMSPSNTSPDLTNPDKTWQPGYFRTAHNDLFLGAVAAEFAYNELGARSAAAIHDGDPYTEGLASSFRDSFIAMGGEITSFEGVNKGDTDMRPVLTSIAASSPDVLYFPIFEPEGNFVGAQSSEVPGLENTTLMGAAGLLVKSFAPNTGSAVDGMYLSGPYISADIPEYAAFLAQYEANTGGPPPAGYAAHAFDATNIILAAIQSVAIADDDGTLHVGRQALRDAVEATSGYVGLTGVLSCGDKEFQPGKTYKGDCATGEALAVFELTGAQVSSDENWPPPVVYTPVSGVQAVTTAQECALDLTGEEVVIYQQAGTEGPIASILGLAFQFATAQAIEDINAAGGICGAELRVAFRETAYNVDNEVIAYEETREDDPAPFVINTYNSGATVALSDRFNEDQIVAIAAGVNTKAIYVPRGGYTIGVVPVYADQFAGTCQWLVDNWADVKPADAGDDVVVGVIGWQGAYGSGATTPEAIAYCESVGATVLELEQQEISPAYDSTGNLQALVSQGANVIYQQNLSFSTAEVIGTTTALGLRDKVVMIGVNWSGNTDVLNFLGVNVGLMEAVYTNTPYISWDDTDHPGIQQAIAAFDASGSPPNERTFTWLLTYAGLYNQKQVIEHAINTTGWPLTGANFLAAFQDLETVNALGILEWTAAGQQRSPSRTRMSQFQASGDGGVTLVPVSDWFDLPQAWPSP